MTNDLNRREFLAGAVSLAAAAHAGGQTVPSIPLIDTHMHLFDPTRPQGAPWTGPRGASPAPEPALPDRYRRLTASLGIVGAIEIEASPWVEDNLWVLEIAQRDPIMVGTVGNLQPEKPEFAEYLSRYHKNPLFRGIRYGNLWGYDLVAQAANPVFIEGLRLVAQADLVLDTANPRVNLIEAVVRITDKIPDLRVVLDHLPSLDPTPAEQGNYEHLLREIQTRPRIYVKLSAVIHRLNGQLSMDLAPYRSRLDYLTDVFGEDRVLFGSDWPNSDGVAPIERVVAVVKEYFATQPRARAEKYFWRNSIMAYKWIKRDPAQPA